MSLMWGYTEDKYATQTEQGMTKILDQIGAGMGIPWALAIKDSSELE